jgi:hypothetical protein
MVALSILPPSSSYSLSAISIRAGSWEVIITVAPSSFRRGQRLKLRFFQFRVDNAPKLGIIDIKISKYLLGELIL